MVSGRRRRNRAGPRSRSPRPMVALTSASSSWGWSRIRRGGRSAARRSWRRASGRPRRSSFTVATSRGRAGFRASRAARRSVPSPLFRGRMPCPLSRPWHRKRVRLQEPLRAYRADCSPMSPSFSRKRAEHPRWRSSISPASNARPSTASITAAASPTFCSPGLRAKRSSPATLRARPRSIFLRCKRSWPRTNRPAGPKRWWRSRATMR